MTARLSCACACACALAGCGEPDATPSWRAAGNPTPRAGGTLHMAVKDTVRSLDPMLSNDEVTAYATHALFDTLVDYEPTAPGSARTGETIVPGLAERWTISDDGLVYTFVLRAGLVYSDGTPVVADDVRRSLERALTPEAGFGQFLAGLIGAADVANKTSPHARGIEVPDARTLVLRLAKPNATLLGVMTMTFTTPQPTDHPDRAAPIGTGPFELASWTEGTRLVLRKNPRYWDAADIHLDAIELREAIEPDVQFLMFERGELDVMANPSPPDALWIEAQPAWKPDLRTSFAVQAWGARMNVRVPPFDDRRVRQALNYAFDKQHAVKLMQGAATIAHGVLPPGMLGRDDALAPYPHDPAKARALLAAAGYPDGFATDFDVLDDDAMQRVAGSLQADLAEVGVRVRVRAVGGPEWQTELQSSSGPPLMLASWLFDYPDPANAFDACFSSATIAPEGSMNFAFYATPELDALLDRARAERDPAARAAMYRRAEDIVYADAPWVWGWHPEIVEVVQPYVMGYAPHPVWPRDYTRTWLDLGADGERVRP